MTEPTADQEATQLAAEALADLEMEAFAVQGSGLPVSADTVVSTILAAAIPRIRQDERQRCVEAALSVPQPLGSIYSSGFQAGHAAAQRAIAESIEHLPVLVAIEGA